MHINPHPTQMDSYNKYPKGQGTLIANWLEERHLREHEGEGRSLTYSHFPKKREDLYEAELAAIDQQANNTRYRIHGYEG